MVFVVAHHAAVQGHRAVGLLHHPPLGLGNEPGRGGLRSTIRTLKLWVAKLFVKP
jgi:hypothetical protein